MLKNHKEIVKKVKTMLIDVKIVSSFWAWFALIINAQAVNKSMAAVKIIQLRG